jgi:hypothetical protein
MLTAGDIHPLRPAAVTLYMAASGRSIFLEHPEFQCGKTISIRELPARRKHQPGVFGRHPKTLDALAHHA